MAVELAPGVLEIDTRLGGWDRVTAGYLVTGPSPALIETGAQSSVPAVLAELEALGVGPTDLAHIVITHIHLDHAGGVGDVARAFPKATVHVHERGARHLVDPSRLVASAAQVYGPLLDQLYGRLDPTPADRVHVLEDGEAVEIGPGRRLVCIDSPGHAKHHLAVHDEGDGASGLLFAGDAVGVKLPGGGVLRPATPPPDFDLDQALASLQRFAERAPTALCLAHYGLVPNAQALLAEAGDTLRGWAGVAEAAFRDGRDIAEALTAAYGDQLDGVAPAQRERLETLNGVHSNAAGLRRWLDTRRATPTGRGGRPEDPTPARDARTTRPDRAVARSEGPDPRVEGADAAGRPQSASAEPSGGPDPQSADAAATEPRAARPGPSHPHPH